MTQPFLCRVGLHKRTYAKHVEHGIIDGPPRIWSRVTCTRCGESHISRDKADALKAWMDQPWMVR
jgi:hypothetical protein